VHLVEILLPVADNEGQPFDAHKYAVVGGLGNLAERSARRRSRVLIPTATRSCWVAPTRTPLRIALQELEL
jgi:hypothetical protein